MASKDEKTLATLENSKLNQFPVLVGQFEGENPLDVMRENMGDQGLRALDLDRLRIPSGIQPNQQPVFMVPGLTGPEMVKSFDGIIIHWTSPRVYWQQAYGDGDVTLPDCASDDGKMGRGAPGGVCASCPLNVFGSDPKSGRSKACKEMRQLFILRPGNILPDVLVLPPTSIAAFQTLAMRLVQKAISYWKVVVRVSLEKQTQKVGGVTYAVATIEVVDALPPEDVARIKEYRDGIIPQLEATAQRPEDYAQAGVR